MKYKKRIISSVVVLLAVLIFSASKKGPEQRQTIIEIEEEIIEEEEIIYIAETLGLEEEVEERAPLDELDKLFVKFSVPYEYRDYTRQICMLQNVDPIVFVSLVQIESHWGQSENGVTADYNVEVDYRMYGPNKEWTDLGLAQLSTRYKDEHEERYFNPELIFSLGYVREEFDQRDPWINLQVGAAYLGFLYRYFGDYDLAVQAYNCGIGNVINGNVPNITYAYNKAIKNSWKFREGDT